MNGERLDREFKKWTEISEGQERAKSELYYDGMLG
jgi:hypothetical protein